MTVSDIINIVLAALAVIVGFLATYFKGNTKLYSRVASYIALAEATYTDANSGGVKMQYVVGKLYALLPVWIRPFIPQAVVQTIAQAIFNQVAAYATLQLNKTMNTAMLGTTGPVIGTVSDTAAATPSATAAATPAAASDASAK